MRISNKKRLSLATFVSLALTGCFDSDGTVSPVNETLKAQLGVSSGASDTIDEYGKSRTKANNHFTPITGNVICNGKPVDGQGYFEYHRGEKITCKLGDGDDAAVLGSFDGSKLAVQDNSGETPQANIFSTENNEVLADLGDEKASQAKATMEVVFNSLDVCSTGKLCLDESSLEEDINIAGLSINVNELITAVTDKDTEEVVLEQLQPEVLKESLVVIEQKKPIGVSAVSGNPVGGTITPAFLSTKTNGTLTFEVRAKQGYIIDGVAGCNGELSTNKTTYTTGVITEPCDVIANFIKEDVKTYEVEAIFSSEDGLVIPRSMKITEGETGSFNITPKTGYIIDSVAGCEGKLVGNVFTTKTISAACDIDVTFKEQSFTLTASATEGGSISPEAVNAVYGTTQTFIITPELGYNIAAVTGCAGTLDGNTYTTSAVTSKCSVAATFTPIETTPEVVYFDLTATAGVGGSIDPASAKVKEGDTQTFTIKSNAGYKINSVTGCDGKLDGDKYTTNAITAACSVTATFSLIDTTPEVVYFDLTATAGVGGSIAPLKANVKEGNFQAFTITPKVGYNIAQVTGCAGTLNGNVFTTSAVSGACTVNATFKKQRFTLTGTATDGGSIVPTSINADYGTTQTFTITPAAGYNIAAVTGCPGTLNGNTFTTDVITEACALSATFSQEVTWTVTTTASTGGQISPSSAIVADGDKAEFSINPDASYTIDSIEGCNGVLDATGQNFVIDSVTAACSINVNFIHNVDLAIKNRSHLYVAENELIDYAIEKRIGVVNQHNAVLNYFYKEVGPLTWFPHHDSLYLQNASGDNNFEILRGNKRGTRGTNPASAIIDSSANVSLGFAGTRRNGAKYVAMGGNMFAIPAEGGDAFLQNTISWLVNDLSVTVERPLKIVASHIPDQHYFRHFPAVKEWFDKYYLNQYQMNGFRACDYDALQTCLTSQPDLLIISNNDYQEKGYASISEAIDYAEQNQIPVLYLAYSRSLNDFTVKLLNYTGATGYTHYWDLYNSYQVELADLVATNPMTNDSVISLLNKYRDDSFDIAQLDACKGNFLHSCNTKEWTDYFKSGADTFRARMMGLDATGTDVFDLPDDSFIKAIVLLADKYRSKIDYPITREEPNAWFEAMFADWVVNYARQDNFPQPDLGEFVWDKTRVKKYEDANYQYPMTVTGSVKVIGIKEPNQWTTTGWYALPGQAITLTRQDTGQHIVKIRLNYHRTGTNRSYESNYMTPLEIATERLVLPPGEAVTFSTPYGGPIYLAMYSGSSAETVLNTTIRADGVTEHPNIMDFGSDEQIARFEELLDTTELPHVDLRSDSAEQHLRRDRFTNAIGDEYPTTADLLQGIVGDHLTNVYSLAGLQVPGKAMEDSLWTNVKSACLALFGSADCLDAKLHNRSRIQHANYDQNAHCGFGCSGNPWDSGASAITPTGWLDNHELGHNLQVHRLNVAYVTEANKNNWKEYGSRAGENSNNIFPYYVKWWKHYIRDGETSGAEDGHVHYKHLFDAFMSDALQMQDANGNRVVLDSACKTFSTATATSRYEAPWLSNAYAIDNQYRMGFYLQLALRMHNKVLRDGTKLTNGYEIFPILYQHQRIFGKYATAAEWEANKVRLGFDKFAFDVTADFNMTKIPGNDFMLVSLSYLTEENWAPYFDMWGLRYSDLAKEQAAAHGSTPVEMGMYVLETDLPPLNLSEGLVWLPLSLENPETLWPRATGEQAETSYASPKFCTGYKSGLTQSAMY